MGGYLEYSVKTKRFCQSGLQADTSYYLPTSLNTVKEVSFVLLRPENLSLSADVKGRNQASWLRLSLIFWARARLF
jgi:hypothetical protein